MSIRKWWQEDNRPLDVELAEDAIPLKIKGKIFHLNRDEGWGFISSEEEGFKFRRIYFHWTALIQDTLTFEKLETNMEVEFSPIEGDRGWKSHFIKVLTPEEKVKE